MTTESGPTPSAGLVVGTLIVYILAGLLTGGFEVLLVPLRIGSTMIPVSPVLAVISNAVLPRMARSITGNVAGAVAPVLGWLVAVVALASGRPEGDVLLSGGSNGDAVVGYVMMIAGLVAGVTSVLRGASLAGTAGRADRRVESRR